MLKTVLFDLDGTLTESGPGIVNGVKYALEKAGITETDESRLTQFIGPPLYLTFMRLYGMEEGKARAMVPLYKEYYDKQGVFENAPYEGITEMLRALKDAGFTLGVASAKPQDMVDTVVTHFHLRSFFDEVRGAHDTGAPDTKRRSITEAMAALHVSPDETVMVGDRRDDIEGAAACGVKAIGVKWGYAPAGELEQTGAVKLVQSPSECTKYLTNYNILQKL